MLHTKFFTFCLGTFLALVPIPASAAITQIVGSGTGGAIGGLSFSGTASLGITTNTTIPANSLVVGIVAACQGGSVTSFAVSDTHSNSYTAPRAIDQSTGASQQIFYSYTGTQITSGDTITVTQTGGTTGCLTGQVLAFSGAASSPYDVSTGGSNSGASGTITVGPTATLACPTAAAGCEVLVGGMVLHNSGTTTNDANFTSTVTTGAGQNWIIGFWIVGATTARSFAPSTNTSTNYGAQLVAFKAATSASTKRLLMNAVP